MMKKLLVLALVLGMATVSQAAISFTATGAVGNQLTVTAGATITINIVADGTCYGLEMTAVESASVDSSGHATAIVDKGGMISSIALGTGQSWADTAVLADSGNYDGALVAWAGTYGTTAAGTTLMSFVYVVGSTPGYWVAPMVEGIANLPFNSVDVADSVGGYGNILNQSDHVLMGGLQLVPEPMTIALLGLGGLFLRRRK